VSTAAATLAEQVNAFFIALRNGPMDRREAGDPNYGGPERRVATSQYHAGESQKLKIA